MTLTGAAGTLHVPVTVQSEGAPTAAPGTTPAPPARPVTRPAADTPPAGPPAPPEPARPVRAVSTVTRWAAGLAIGAGAVLAVAIVAGALVVDVPVGVLYALHPALLIAGGLCILRPASRTLGLGMVAGAGATAVLPAMLLATAIGAHVVTQRRIGPCSSWWSSCWAPSRRPRVGLGPRAGARSSGRCCGGRRAWSWSRPR